MSNLWKNSGRKIASILIFSSAHAIVLLSCTNMAPSSGTLLHLYITSEASFDSEVDEFVVAIEKAEVYSNGEKEWFELSFPIAQQEDTVVDLIPLQDSTSVHFNDSFLPADSYSKLRLLFTVHRATIAGVDALVEIKESHAGGVVISLKRFFDIREGEKRDMLLVMGAKQLRWQKKDGTYIFTPQIRVVSYGTTGSIVGDVEPSGINAVVYLMQRSDTLGTVIPDPESGDYGFYHLEEDEYDLHVSAEGYQPLSEFNVIVTAGTTTAHHDFLMQPDDVLFYEDFEDDPDGLEPLRWTLKNTNPEGQSATIDRTNAFGGWQSLMMVDVNEQRSTGPVASIGFEAYGDSLSFEFSICAQDTNTQVTVLLEGKKSPEGMGTGFGFYSDGTLGFAVGDSIGAYETTQWYRVKLVFRPVEDLFDLYVNDMDIPIVSNRKLNFPRSEFEAIEISALSGTGWIDNLIIKKLY